MDKVILIEKIKTEISELRKIQKIIDAKNPSYPCLDPTINNAIAMLVELRAYLEGKHPYYIGFSEVLFNYRQTAMHRAFFSDLHIGVEECLGELIKNQDFEMVIHRNELAKGIIASIKEKISNSEVLTPEFKKIMKLGGNFPTFNDYLNTTLNSIKSLEEDYRIACRAYFDALSIIRNKVSHSDVPLTDEEKSKLIKAKFKNAIAGDGFLQMTFEGYRHLLQDVIRFFDKMYSSL